MTDLVSVVIPSYNHEAFVGQTIQSVLAQTYQAIELIVVDDGSSDESRARILELKERCEARLHRFVFIEKENEGVSMTLNRGIDVAEGAFLFLVASDDVVSPRALEVLHGLIREEESVAAVVGDNQIIDEHGNRAFWASGTRELTFDAAQAKYKTSSDLIVDLAGDPEILTRHLGSYRWFLRGCLIPNGVLYRTSAVREVGKFNPECSMEDWYMHLQLSKKYDYRYVDEICLSYRQHSSNTWVETSSSDFAPETRTVMWQERPYCTENGLEEHWLQCYVNLGCHLLDEREEAMKAYEKEDFAAAFETFYRYVRVYRGRCEAKDFLCGINSALRFGRTDAARELILLARDTRLGKEAQSVGLLDRLHALSVRLDQGA